MNPSPKDGETINFKKMVEDIDSRFVSGNDVPVERAAIRAWEWSEIKRVIADLKGRKDVAK